MQQCERGWVKKPSRPALQAETGIHRLPITRRNTWSRDPSVRRDLEDHQIWGLPRPVADGPMGPQHSAGSLSQHDRPLCLQRIAMPGAFIRSQCMLISSQPNDWKRIAFDGRQSLASIVRRVNLRSRIPASRNRSTCLNSAESYARLSSRYWLHRWHSLTLNPGPHSFASVSRTLAAVEYTIAVWPLWLPACIATNTGSSAWHAQITVRILSVGRKYNLTSEPALFAVVAHNDPALCFCRIHFISKPNSL